MTFKTFLHKLFPCMKNNEEQLPSPSLQKQQRFLEEQLSNDRQKRLEESRLAELERLANEAEELQHQKESAERIAALVAEEQEAEERALDEVLKNIEAERLELERLELERLELERLELERLEAERLEAERLEAERLEAERLKERLKERLEAERLEAERLETERIVKNVFQQYKDKFHEFFSSRPQPIHSNFNEKMFKDLCHTFTFNTEDGLLVCLDGYNLMQKQNKEAYNQLSRKRKLKCDVFNFYLFIDCNHTKNI